MYSELGRSPGASLFLRGISPNPCGAQVAFRLCRGKVPRPRRCSDEHFLVKPFSRVLVRGISPNPCACCASAPSQPQSLRDSPFQGQAGSASLRRASPLLIRFANSLPLRRAACAAPPGVAFRFCRSRRNSNYSYASALCCGGAIRQTRPRVVVSDRIPTASGVTDTPCGPPSVMSACHSGPCGP